MNKELYFEKPVFNVPPHILENWKGNIILATEREPCFTGLKLTSPRYIKNCKEHVRVCSVHMHEGELRLRLYGVAAKDIDAIIVADSDTNPGELQYIAYYATIAKEKQFGSNQLQYMDQPTMGVGAILWHVNEDEEIELLLGRRIKGPPTYLNRLSNFGGAIEKGETLWEALSRELKEEVGLNLPKLSPGAKEPILNTNITIQQYDEGHFYHAFSATFTIEVPDKSLVKNMEPHKTRNFGWYKLKELLAHSEDLTPLCRESILEWV